MSQYLLLYGATLIAFLGLDMLGLGFVVKPVFERHIGHLFLEDFRLGAAALFYLLYVAGILWFVSAPAMAGGKSLLWVFGNAAFLGALAYGTYEVTNYATLKGWALQMVLIDITWGAILTGTSAVAGMLALRTFWP